MKFDLHVYVLGARDFFEDGFNKPKVLDNISEYFILCEYLICCMYRNINDCIWIALSYLAYDLIFVIINV